MRIRIISIEPRGSEFSLSIPGDIPGLVWENDINPDPDNHFCVDMDFDGSRERITALGKSYPGLIAVNSVIHTLPELPGRFVRFNGWKGFLKGPLIEAAATEKNKKKAEELFSLLGKKPEWVADETGFISPRIVSMIINEAYYALEENLSSKKEIDTAMKLGTNYPFGPFEWSEIIGLKKIHELLKNLSVTNKRYLPSPLLEKAAR